MEIRHALRNLRRWGAPQRRRTPWFVAPDFVLVAREASDTFVTAMKKALREFYGDDPARCEDYGRIVNQAHFERLVNYLRDEKAVHGGRHAAKDLFIAPTILADVSPDSAVMQEEIFRPILPVLEFDKLDEALALLRDRPTPLAMYLFTRDRATETRVLADARSGGACVNDVVLHTIGAGLPFGGLAASGMGASHGRAGFEALWRGERRADAVVVNADFGHAMTTLVPNGLRRRWTDDVIARKRFSCSTFMLYLGVEGHFDQLAHHNIYVAKDYRRNLDQIEEQHVLSEDPSFYVENPVRTDATMAPPGHSALYVLLPVTHQHPNVDWSKERARYRGVALRQLEKLGITDIEKRIRFERVVTPADWENKVDIYRGATFNLAHNFAQMLHLRPQNRFEEFDRMYLVGGGTHPGSGLPVIFESARISTRLLLKDLGLAS